MNIRGGKQMKDMTEKVAVCLGFVLQCRDGQCSNVCRDT